MEVVFGVELFAAEKLDAPFQPVKKNKFAKKKLMQIYYDIIAVN